MDATAFAHRALDRATALATNSRAPGMVSAVLVVALAWQLALVTWGALPPAAPAAPPEQTHAPATPAGDRQAEGPPPATRLTRMDLFGTAPTRDTDVALAAKASETVLDLTLKGVFTSESGGAFAIIAAGGRDERVYAVGDRIAGNARIIGIFPTRVLLRRNGHAEVLHMANRANNMGALSATNNDDTGDAEQRQHMAQRARQLRQRVLNDPASITKLVRFQPATRGGELVGYRIVPRGKKNPLAAFGLRPGDILTRLNGIPLTDPRKASRALASLRDARRIEVSYLRGGELRRLTIPIGAS